MVQQVPIFVEESDDVAMLHQHVGHIEHQGTNGERRTRAVTQRNGIGVLIFAVTRVRVEVDPPDQLAVVVKLIRFCQRVPFRRLPWANVDAEHVLGEL